MSRGVLSTGGFCPPGGFVQGGIDRGVLSGGFCPGGFVQGGFVLESVAELDVIEFSNLLLLSQS